MDARIQALPFDPAALQRPVDEADRQPPPEQLRRRGQAAQRHPRAARRDAPSPRAPGFQLNGLKREELIATNSMLLHELYFAQPRRRRPDDGAGDGAGARRQLRQRRALARGVRRDGQGAGRRLGLGAADASSRARARWSTSGPPTTPMRWPAACRSWRWTCTSTPTTWTSARRPAPTSMPSWPTSTGRRSTSATSTPCTRPASRSAAAQDEIGRRRAARRAPRRRVSSRPRTMIPGARWRDPAAVADWAGELPRRPRGGRLLRLWPRGRPRHRDAPARRGPERALPARRHRRLAGRRPAAAGPKGAAP